MMQHKKSDMILLYVSIGSFFLVSLSFLIMPVRMSAIEPQILSIITGSVFWVFLIIGVVAQVILARRKNMWLRKNHLQRDRHFLHSKIGVIAFAQNLYGFIADVVLGMSLVFLIFALLLTKSAGYVCFVAIAIFVFAFCMHCILNGKIFYYVQNQDKILSEKERKKE